MKVQTLAILAAIVGAVAIPQIFHALGAVSGLGTALGETFLPMHLPIILVGLLAGPYAGAIAGLFGPLDSFALSWMPGIAMLPYSLVVVPFVRRRFCLRYMPLETKASVLRLFGLEGFFKRIERSEDSKPPSLQSLDEEYIAYCVEQEQTIRKMEESLHASDDPKEIAIQTLRTICSFYDCDWAGVIELDLKLNIATSGWWYSPNPSAMKSVKAYEYESISHMHTWLHSIKSGAPVIIHNTADTKITSPQEHPVYKRFDVQSIAAVPFGPNPVGFLVVRNSKRYINRTSTLNALAYVVHRAMAQRNYIESAKMSLSSNGIKDDKDIEYTSTGYRPNPILRIKTDLKQFEDIWRGYSSFIWLLYKGRGLGKGAELFPEWYYGC